MQGIFLKLLTILLYAVDWKKLPILTPNSKSHHSFHWCDVVLCCTFKNRSIIFSCQLWQSKSLWCWQFTAVSLFSPSNVGLWISSGITEQDQPTSFYNLISWWGMVNIREGCRDNTSNTMTIGTIKLHQDQRKKMFESSSMCISLLTTCTCTLQ